MYISFLRRYFVKFISNFQCISNTTQSKFLVDVVLLSRSNLNGVLHVEENFLWYLSHLEVFVERSIVLRGCSQESLTIYVSIFKEPLVSGRIFSAKLVKKLFLLLLCLISSPGSSCDFIEKITNRIRFLAIIRRRASRDGSLTLVAKEFIEGRANIRNSEGSSWGWKGALASAHLELRVHDKTCVAALLLLNS